MINLGCNRPCLAVDTFDGVINKMNFFVVKVFIPKAFPFYLLEKYGTFESDRLREFSEWKGVKDWKLSTLPHMFS